MKTITTTITTANSKRDAAFASLQNFLLAIESAGAPIREQLNDEIRSFANNPKLFSFRKVDNRSCELAVSINTENFITLLLSDVAPQSAKFQLELTSVNTIDCSQFSSLDSGSIRPRITTKTCGTLEDAQQDLDQKVLSVFESVKVLKSLALSV